MEQHAPTLNPTTQLGPHAVTVGDGAGGALEVTNRPDAYPQARLTRAGMTSLSVTLDRAKLRALRDWCTLQLEPELPDSTADGYAWPDLPELDTTELQDAGRPLSVDAGPCLPECMAEGDHRVGGCTTETVTAEAERHQYGGRENDYGHPRQNLTRTAIMWTALLQHVLADGTHLEPAYVARLMVAVKLSRDVESPKRDNRVDMAGYALCLDRLDTGL